MPIFNFFLSFGSVTFLSCGFSSVLILFARKRLSFVPFHPYNGVRCILLALFVKKFSIPAFFLLSFHSMSQVKEVFA